MNFTAAAIVISTLLIAAFALSVVPPIVETGYTPLSKLEALDYVAVVNALAAAQRGEDFEGFLSRELEEPFRVLELVVNGREKRAVVVVYHGWANVTVEAYLRLEVVSTGEGYVAGQRVTIYRVRVESDRPVQLGFNASAIPLGAGEYLVYGPFHAEDVRGLRVEP